MIVENGDGDVVKTGWNSVSAETDLLFDKMIVKLWDQASLVFRKKSAYHQWNSKMVQRFV